ncbi:MAG: dipicolinate synthase subunit B [Oscillospiraceae bacterium]|nr:dipicolinate synthase subunit B [Oscillospiraceae bacterium]
MKGITVGFAMCGSFCTFENTLKLMEALRCEGAEVLPVMSFNAASLDTRFGTAESFRARVETICGRPAIRTIEDAEPIGPQKMCDILLVAPCTGNTLAKLAAGITDTPVTMAVKSHLRGGCPVVLAVSTNDALSAAAKNIGELMNRRHYYFVPLLQDDCARKPTSLTADLRLAPEALRAALSGVQLQPVLAV